MKDKLIPAAIGAAIGGALVLWWLKRRTCRCHEANVFEAVHPVESADDDDDIDEDGAMFPEHVVLGDGGTFDTVATGSTSATGGGHGCSGCGSPAFENVRPPISVAPTPTGGLGDLVTGVQPGAFANYLGGSRTVMG